MTIGWVSLTAFNLRPGHVFEEIQYTKLSYISSHPIPSRIFVVGPNSSYMQQAY